MAATVRFTDGTVARVEDGAWTSTDRLAAEHLDYFTRVWYERPDYVPDHDLAIAEAAAAKYGGEVIEQDEPPPDTVGLVF